MKARTPFIVVGVWAITIAAGFVAGRWLTQKPLPEWQFVHVDRVRTVIESKSTAQETTRTDANKEKVVTVDRIRTVAGEIREHVTVVYRDRVVTVAAKTAQTELHADTTRQTSTSEIQKPTPLPQWTIGVGAGGAVDVVPLSVAPAYFLTAERRIVGPFSAGLWLTAQPTGFRFQGGLVLSAQF